MNNNNNSIIDNNIKIIIKYNNSKSFIRKLFRKIIRKFKKIFYLLENLFLTTKIYSNEQIIFWCLIWCAVGLVTIIISKNIPKI